MSAPEADLAIDAEGVRKAFGRTVVLRDLTLRVKKGEALAVFGPNGAGKSTLLRLCATLYRPGRGTLRLFGSEDTGTVLRRRLSLLGHQSYLYPDLSALENLVFYARLYGLAGAERVAETWLERVGLSASRNSPVRTFSRGMEQRLALARALLHAPDLLLLDEPWTGLDAEGADLLTGLLTELRREGCTLVTATHDFDRGLDVADRAVILHRGRIVWESAIVAGARPALDAIYRRVTGAIAA